MDIKDISQFIAEEPDANGDRYFSEFTFTYSDDNKYLVRYKHSVVHAECVRAIMFVCSEHLRLISDEEADAVNKAENDEARGMDLVSPEQRKEYDAKEEDSKKGFVYLMQHDVDAHTKIGFSKQPTTREATLRSADFNLRIVALFKGTMEDERWLHKRFSSKRIRGEWFNLNEEDIQKIKSVMQESFL